MTRKDTSVLVVEDDYSTLQYQRLILENGGFKVAAATSGEEAIEMVADHSPDLVLLDIGLPGIDGFTTCKVIRKFSQVPIIIVTGNSSKTARVRGLDLGADDYITKPFSEEELSARSKAVLRRSTFSDGAGADVSCLCRKALRRLSSPPDFLGAARSVRAAASNVGERARRNIQGRQIPASGPSAQPGSRTQRFLDFEDLDLWGERLQKARRSIARWARLGLARIKLWFLRGCRATQAACLMMGARLEKGVLWTVNSPPVQKIKATGLAEKIVYITHGLLRSDRASKAGRAFSRVWKSGASYRPGLLSPSAKRETPVLDRGAAPGDGAEESLLTDHRQPGLEAFLEQLLRAYIRVAESVGSNPMLSAPVVPLVSVHEEMVADSSGGGAYSREEFIHDVYQLHRSGLNTTPTGARVQFPISRGVDGKTLVVTNEAGEEVRYYGVRFMQSRSPEHQRCPECRPFNASEAARYHAEIQEAFRRQLEWPSEEFARFFAEQVHLGDLTEKESRRFAQMTRDALQEFLRDYSGLETRPDVDHSLSPHA